MKRLLLLATAAICSVCNAQQINKYGVPFITNYAPTASQTLDIVQDQRGIMYFASDDGIIEYDGARWNKIPLLYVQSLAVDDDNIVHVGMDGDFGYLYPNHAGELKFVSITNKLPDSTQIDPIYKTYCIGKTTYYCSNCNIFIAEKDSILKVIDLPEHSFFSFMTGDTLIVSSESNEVSLYYDNSLHYTSLSTGAGLYGVVPHKGNFLFAAGDIMYEGNFNRAPLENLCKANKFIGELYVKHMPYNLSTYKDNVIMSTVLGDKYTVVVFDKDLNPVNAFSKQNGLESNNSLCSKQIGHILWSGLDNRIAKIEMGNIKHYDVMSGLEGAINNAIDINGVLYVGTNDGLYVREFDEYGFPSFNQIDTYAAQRLIEFKVPNSNKTYLISGGAVNVNTYDNGEICNTPIHTDGNSLFQSKLHPEYLYIGSKEKFSCYRYRSKSNDHWEPVYETLSGANVTSISEDRDGNIWCITNKGIFKIMDNGKSFYSYDEENGIPTTYMAMLKNFDGRLLFLTMGGVFEFNEEEKIFEPSDFLGNISADTTCGVWDICEYDDGYIISRNNNNEEFYLEYVTKDAQGKYHVENRGFEKLPKDKNLVYIYIDKEGNLWVAIDVLLYCYRSESIDKYYKEPLNAYVRQVVANDTIMLFGGAFISATGGVALTQPKNNIVELPFNSNSLTFHYSAAFYDEEENTEYSTMLEGDDRTWSKWKKSTEYNRTHLSEGKYTFKVKARNIYGVESSVAEYSFIIKPPFYRTIVAYILYVIMLIVLVYGIVKWNTRRLIEEKKKLEQKIAEATEEIRGQNVQLEQQKDEIEKQKDEIQSSINYARRIQRALLTPDEVIDKIFPDHFLLYKPRNVVSGDYYWFGQFGDNKVSIVADCTGHGVPGGFMSMLGMTNLNYIVGQELRPDEILNKLRNAIITSLRQKDDSIQPTGDDKADRRAAFALATEKKDRSQDGMDVAMYVINEKEMTLSFAGANNPLVLIRDGEVEVIKASKMPVGIYAKLDPFERVDMELKKGDCLYTFSDGFQDQFGFESGKKFMSKHLREVLLEIHQKPMPEQKEILNKIYEDWRGPADHQTDDVVLMGVRI